MYHSGDLLNPTYNGDAYYNKPPLKMWLTQVPLLLFGESNWSYRILDSCLGILLISLVVLFSKKLLGNYSPGIFAGFILLLSKELISGSHGFRTGTQDNLLLVLLTTSYMVLWDILGEKETRKRNEFIFCILVGLSCLTKSVAGLMPLVILALYILFSNGGIKLKLSCIAKITALSLAIPSFYYIYHCIKSPVAWKKFFYIELYERATKGMHHIGEPYFYLRELFVKTSFTFPVITILALTYCILIAYRKKDQRILYLLTLAVVPAIIFSLPNSRLPWYIFPSYVPLSLLIGYFITNVANLVLNSKQTLTRLLSFSLLIYLVHLYEPRVIKVATHYLSIGPDSQLTIDKLAHTVLKNPDLKIYVDPSLVDTRALAGRRKSNRDGFYWMMIQDRISKEIDFQEGILVIPFSKNKEVEKYTGLISSSEILPKSRTRQEEALILYLTP